MSRISLLSVLLVLTLQSMDLLAQRDSSRNDFANAESWFLFEDYAEAEPIYQKLLKYYPDNDNIRYRIGICLLKDPFRKDQSIPYLLEASNNINPRHKEGSINEKTAPPDVLFYLGVAYHANEKLDLAIENYRAFLKIMDPEIYDEDLVKEQIQACENAKRLMSMPVDIDLYLLSESVNTRYTENHPVVSGDGQRMVFITEQPFFDEALFVEKQEDDWTLPMSLTSMLGFDANIYPTGLSYDGSELLLYYDDEHIGNLYHSRLEEGFWLPATKLGEPISTKYWESHASFSADGQSMYFTSNRKGSIGGLDIYRSDKQPNGSWGTPENLGATVNTRYNEETPFITEDGKTLYFSSYGHYNMGGYDIFYSTLNEDGTWTEPVNMGYPINTTGDDLFFMPAKNGLAAYQSRVVNAEEREFDLYYMDIYSVNNPRIYVVTGYVHTQDEETDLTTLQMLVIDPATGDTLQYDIPVDASGRFSLELTQGDYKLHFSREGYHDLITPLSITPQSDKTGIDIEEALEMELVLIEPLVFEGDESKVEVKDTTISAEAGKALIIPVSGLEGATLLSRHLKDSTLVDSDTLVFEKRKAEIEIVPLPGENIVELEMIDEEGNIHKRQITVTGTEHIPTRREIRKMEREMRKVGIPPALIGTPVAAVLLDLRDEADSEQMQDYLDQLDLGEEGIEDPTDLFEHLYDEARAGNLDIEEVDLLLANEISGGDVDKLLEAMTVNASGPLKEYLENLDPPAADRSLEKEGITSVEELLEHLEAAGPANGFAMDDVRNAMLGALEPSEADELLKDMILAAGAASPLAEFLGELDASAEGIYTRGELAEKLYADAEAQGYSPEDVDLLLATVLAGDDAQTLKDALQFYADGALKNYLEDLDPPAADRSLEKEGITTVEELLEHLYAAAADPKNGFSVEDIREALIMALETDPMRVLKYELERKAEGPLKEYLEGLSLRENGIDTPSELFEHLYAVAEDQGFTIEDVDKLLADELAGGDVNRLLQYLLENAEGPLKDYLENLDLEKEGITSVEELLKHLAQAGPDNGFTMEDVRKAMLAAADIPLEVEKLYYELLDRADGDLKDILENLDPPAADRSLEKAGIYTAEDLLKARIEALEERGYSMKEIREMLGELLPEHADLIAELTGKGSSTGKVLGLALGIPLGLFLIFLIFRRRRDEKENVN